VFTYIDDIEHWIRRTSRRIRGKVSGHASVPAPSSHTEEQPAPTP
jgi:hypothetical protein